jgi:hypothetical protein
MILSEALRTWLIIFLMIFLGACAGRMQYSPLQAPDLPSLKEAVILPKSQSWETCLKEAKAASHGSAVYSALVLYCSEHSSDATSANLHISSALKSLSHLAYDYDYRGFTNRRLAANVDLVTTLEKNTTFIFADDYLVAGIRGPELMPGPSVPLIKRTRRATDGVGRFYPCP